MAIIVKNITENNLYINDLGGILIQPNSQRDISLIQNKYNISYSSDLISYISSDLIVINDGLIDLDKSTAIRFITSLDSSPKSPNGKTIIQTTPRIPNTITFFTGEGDDVSSPTNVGGGSQFIHTHNIGDPDKQTLYLDYNIVENETWLREGYISWKDCLFDTVTVSVVTRHPIIQNGSNTNYNLYGGYLIVPAPGNGNIEIVNDISSHVGGLVFMPTSYDGVRPQSFWNAEWDIQNKVFVNITPAPDGDGQYNLFATEIVLGRFVNNVPFLGTGNMVFKTDDISQLGQGMRIKVGFDTGGTDHKWYAGCTFLMYRGKTS